MAGEKEKAQRRVYVLPSELVMRIVAYQNEMGLQSEVEAVRRLLDDALKSRDDWRSITKRFKDKLAETRVLSDIAKDVLVGHPLVNQLAMEPGLIRFTLTTGEEVVVGSNGEVSAQDQYRSKLDFEPGSMESDDPFDDDVPF